MTTEARSLPIAIDHREFVIKVAGEPLPREHQLLSVSVISTANKIASARLVFLDGAAASSDFPLSNGDLFIPGQAVEITAGTGRDSAKLFAGVVTRHSIKVRDNTAPQLVIECRHAAMSLSVGRRSKSYFDQKDSDIIESLLAASGASVQVETSTVTHAQLVQFNASDWDFLLARAEANGLLVLTRADEIVVRKPVMGQAPVCALQFGATIIEMDAQIEARDQYAAVQGISWDAAQQEQVSAAASEPSIAGPGNLKPADLAQVAGLEALELRHPSLPEAEAKVWAEAAWQRAQLNKVSGRAKCEGIGNVYPGDIVSLGGAGERFTGEVFVTGVRHEFDLVCGWKTHLQFGGVDARGDASTSQPAAGGLLPAVAGLQIGVVVSNEDPQGEHRVRIRLPMVSTEDDGIWARVASMDAGDDRGFFFRPEIGDEVLVGFLADDPRCPAVLGMLHSSAKAAPLTGSDDNHEKLYKSRSGMRIAFNDDTKVMSLDTPAGNSLTLSEDDKSIVLKDQHGNKIEMNADGITIESSKALQLKASTELGLESGTSFSAKGGTDLKLEGATQAELSSSATTKIAGGMVQIN